MVGDWRDLKQACGRPTRGPFPRCGQLAALGGAGRLASGHDKGGGGEGLFTGPQLAGPWRVIRPDPLALQKGDTEARRGAATAQGHTKVSAELGVGPGPPGFSLRELGHLPILSQGVTHRDRGRRIHSFIFAAPSGLLRRPRAPSLGAPLERQS